MSGFGAMLALDLLLGALVCCHYARGAGLDPFDALKALFCGVAGGLAASRMAYVVFNAGVYANDPMAALRVWEGGFLPGFGIYAGALCAWAVSRPLEKRVNDLMDIIAAPLLLFIGIGHAACALNGEGMGFLLSAGASLPLYLFRAMYCGLAGAFVGYMRPYLRHGESLPLSLALYAAGNVVFESMARSSVYLGFVRVDQALYMLVLIAYAGVLCYRVRGRRALCAVGCALTLALTAAAFLLEFYMGYNTQYAHWGLMALCMACILAVYALLMAKGASFGTAGHSGAQSDSTGLHG